MRPGSGGISFPEPIGIQYYGGMQMSMLLKFYVQKVMTNIIAPKFRQQKTTPDKKRSKD
jgi:hypothetical protein